MINSNEKISTNKGRGQVNHTMKKNVVLPILLAGTFVLTACSQSEAPDDRPVHITMWHYYNGAQKDQFDELVQKFNDTVGLDQKIIVETFSKGSVTELEDAITASMDGKTGSDPLPNLCSSYADTAYKLYQKDLLVDYRPFLTDEEYNSYVSGYVEEGNFGSESSMMIFPIAKSTEVLTLNNTAWEPFAKETGASLENLSTWEGLAQTAKSYYEWTDAKTEEPNDGQAFFGRDSFANHMLIGSHQLGHTIYVSEDGAIKTDAEKETMRRLWDNYYVPYISGYYLAEGKFRSDDLKTGRIAAYVGSTSGAAYTPEQVTYDDGTTEDITCSQLPLPNFEGTEACAVQQGAGVVMFDADEKTEKAAVTFLKWLTEDEQNVCFSAASGYLPVKVSANNMEEINNYFKESGQELNPKLEAMLHTAIPQVQQYELYTTKPFEHANDARKIIDSTLPALAKANREQVQALLAEGSSLADAVAQYSTDDMFEAWYEDTESQLNHLAD